ncbi:hypothetical protein [Paenibacillus hemerocallicola]|uniref:hypothetical protein n=1 Tax=Paenibacillus hemerocallicola TaxID=1172614 RepID=UPI00319D9A4F
MKLIEPSIIEEYRLKAEEIRKNGRPKNWLMGMLFIALWIALAVWAGFVILKAWR